ncbi:hypothetical protein EJB05_55224, partial [Eragrostis curvula]
MAADPVVEEAETRAKQRRGVVAVVALAVTKYLLPVTYRPRDIMELLETPLLLLEAETCMLGYNFLNPAQRNHRSGVNENHAPKINLVIDPCEMKVYKVKATELTGNPDTDKLIRDYVASFNEIQQERCRYVELKYGNGAGRVNPCPPRHVCRVKIHARPRPCG